MYIYLAAINKTISAPRFLSLSIAALLSMTSYSAMAEDILPPAVGVNTITPDQYQQQRSEALKQQQLSRPTVNIDTTEFQVTSPSASPTTDSAAAPCFDINNIYLTVS